MTRGARPSQFAVTGMATVLWLWNRRASLSDCKYLRGEEGAELSASTEPTLDVGHAPVSVPNDLWGTRRGSLAATRICVCFLRTLSESRMLEIGTSGLTSGERKRAVVYGVHRAFPRLYKLLRAKREQERTTPGQTRAPGSQADLA